MTANIVCEVCRKQALGTIIDYCADCENYLRGRFYVSTCCTANLLLDGVVVTVEQYDEYMSACRVKKHENLGT